MSKKPIIAWKNRLFDVTSMKNVTHSVSSIHVDSFASTVKVVVEKGLTVQQFEMTMEQAQLIGFINVNSLLEYCNF